MKTRKRKYRFFRRLLFLLVIAGLVIADSRYRIQTTEYELSFAALPAQFDGVRVVQLSDVHGAEFGEGNARLISAVAEAAPDLIVLTGDLADRDTDLQRTETLLSGLTELAPVYYISGNHEWGEGRIAELSVLLSRLGVCYLKNEYLPIERDGAQIILAGVEDPNSRLDMERPDRMAERLRADYPEDFVLLLGHRNDWPETYPDLPVDLILCGHAHGGQVRLPVLGGLYGPGRDFLPEYTEGIYRCGSYRMLVSRGLGNSAPVPRVFNPPELVALTLRAESA